MADAEKSDMDPIWQPDWDRRFVVVGHRARTDAAFALDDLCGATGRLDILCRCVNAAFMLSHGIRKSTELALLLLGPPNPPKCIRLEGARLKYLNPDERSTAARLRHALAEVSFGPEVTVDAGLFVAPRSFETVLSASARRGPIVALLEDGDDIRRRLCDRARPDAGITSDRATTFVIGDHEGFTADEKRLLGQYAHARLSVGPHSLHADHCIVVIHNELDRHEARV